MLTFRNPSASLKPRTAGFSLVELTIVVVILGVLAMMGVPRYQVAVEKAKSSEAYTYLAHVAKAQEMYRARTGIYSDSLAQLAVSIPTPSHFSVGTPSSFDWETRWQLKLTRKGPSSGFGAYSVAWGEEGFDAGRSSIPASLSPTGVGGSNAVSSSSGGASSNGGSAGSGNGGGSPAPAPPASNSGNGSGNGGQSNANNGGRDNGNNGVGNGNGGGRDGNRGQAEPSRDRGNRVPSGGRDNGNNGVGNGNGGGRDGNRGRGNG